MMKRQSRWAARLAAGVGLCGAVATACAPSVDFGGTGAAASGTGSAGGLIGGGGGYAPVSCSTPAGATVAFASIDDAYAKVVGDWRFCPPPFPGLPADTIGIRFAPGSATLDPGLGSTVGGLAYYLVESPAGPVPGAGFAYQLTYSIAPPQEGISYALYLHDLLGGNGGSVQFSPSPRVLQFELDVAPFNVVLVAL